jgi:hypothetical protein
MLEIPSKCLKIQLFIRAILATKREYHVNLLRLRDMHVVPYKSPLEEI